VTNPYGTDPGSQPQGLGTPVTQGPQFVAPGTPGQYGPPQYGPPQYGPPGPPQGPPARPQYAQPGPYGPPPTYPMPPPPQPYGQNFQQPYGQNFQQPYGQGYQPPRAPQPPSKRSSSPAIVIVVVLALVVGIVFGGYAVWTSSTAKPVTQPTPTRQATGTTAGQPSATIRPTATSGTTAGSTDCAAGDTITASAFIATVPANWSCDGDDGDISITSTRSDAIWVDHGSGAGDAADCKSQIEELGPVTALPQESWGGKTALAYQAVDSGDIFGVRCAVVGGQAWYLMYFPLDANDDATVRADVTKVLSTWVWK